MIFDFRKSSSTLKDFSSLFNFGLTLRFFFLEKCNKICYFLNVCIILIISKKFEICNLYSAIHNIVSITIV